MNDWQTSPEQFEHSESDYEHAKADRSHGKNDLEHALKDLDCALDDFKHALKDFRKLDERLEDVVKLAKEESVEVSLSDIKQHVIVQAGVSHSD